MNNLLNLKLTVEQKSLINTMTKLELEELLFEFDDDKSQIYFKGAIFEKTNMNKLAHVERIMKIQPCQDYGDGDDADA